MILQGNKIILTDDQATAHFGDDWIESIANQGGSIFFDGFEVYAKRKTNGCFDRLELTAVYEETDFEAIYG